MNAAFAIPDPLAAQCFARSLAATLIVDCDGLVVAVNDEAARLFQRRRGPLVGEPVSALVMASNDLLAALRWSIAGEGRQRADAVIADGSKNGQRGTLTFDPVRSDHRAQFVAIQWTPADGGHDDRLALGRVKDDLARLNEVLMNRNDDLERFAFVAAHDLQEPLRKISMLLDMLERDAADRLASSDAALVGKARAAATRTRELVRGLLGLALAANGPRASEVVALEDVVKDAAARQIDDVAPDAQVSIAPIPNVQGDRVLLEQLFANLLGNAVKHRRDEPLRIDIGAAPGDRCFVISVSDNGQGFDMAQHDRIFRPFTQLTSLREGSGAGIGLSICRQIVQRHGGRIWAESAPGKGSTFFVELPAAGR